jgi:hypothetical protein
VNELAVVAQNARDLLPSEAVVEPWTGTVFAITHARLGSVSVDYKARMFVLGATSRVRGGTYYSGRGWFAELVCDAWAALTALERK